MNFTKASDNEEQKTQEREEHESDSSGICTFLKGLLFIFNSLVVFSLYVFQGYFYVLKIFPDNFCHSMSLVAKLTTKESENKHSHAPGLSHDHGHTHEHWSSPGDFSTRDKPLYRTDFDKVQNIMNIYKICLKAEKLSYNFVKKNYASLV